MRRAKYEVLRGHTYHLGKMGGIFCGMDLRFPCLFHIHQQQLLSLVLIEQELAQAGATTIPKMPPNGFQTQQVRTSCPE